MTFESSVLFDTGKNEIKDAGKAALNSCIPVYIHTLLSDEYRDYVGEIIVEGHTDTTGQYLNNLALSQQRALAVATYCLSDEMTGLSDADKETFKSILTANGRAAQLQTRSGLVRGRHGRTWMPLLPPRGHQATA